jgi:hypothetical protein
MDVVFIGPSVEELLVIIFLTLYAIDVLKSKRKCLFGRTASVV